jgi:hypothetical protein
MHLRLQVERWTDLDRPRRRQLAEALRRLGLSYGEIAEVVPISKSTLSIWCRDVTLSPEQIAAIAHRTGPRVGVHRDTQHRRRDEVLAIRAAARRCATALLQDPFFVAGVALYWGEGGKTKKVLAITNTDPRLLNLFIRWVRRFADSEAEFVLSLHLHAANNVDAAVAYWSEKLDLDCPSFTKPYFKAAGTGHRKNRLPHGVCRVTVRRSTDAWYRVMTWIDELARHPVDRLIATLPEGR